MKIFLIRHGETPDNRRRVHQKPDSQLSEKGRIQASRVAKYLKDKRIEYVFSSDFDRSKETAGIIADALEVPMVTNALFREVRRPYSMYGRSHFSPYSVFYVLSILWHRNVRGWHFKDAESIYETHERIGEALKKLESFCDEYQNVAVVSHAIFLEILISFLCRNGETRFVDYLPIFSPFSTYKNGSVTELTLHKATEGTNVCKWEVNEQNHTEHLKG